MTGRRRVNRTSRRRILWIVVALPLLALVAASVLVWLQIRQEALDRALIQAVKKLDAPAVNRLLSVGASANARDTGEPPLTVSRLLKRLLARLQHRSDGVPDGERKPVLSVLLSWDILRVRESRSAPDTIAVMLIRHGADIHVRDAFTYRTPLQIAAYAGLHQTVSLLLLRGADVNARDNDGCTSLMFADGDDTELLLKHGASVHVTSTGWTPLTYALTIGHFKAAKVLIQHDVAVNAIDNNGLSTLYYAETISSGVPDRTAIIRVLKQRGARLNQKDKEYLARNRAHAL